MQHSVLAALVFPSVTYHLGYRREELVGQSWYSLLHPEDADLAAAQHRALGECQAREHLCYPLAPWSGYSRNVAIQDSSDKGNSALSVVPAAKRMSRELVTHPICCL